MEVNECKKDRICVGKGGEWREAIRFLLFLSCLFFFFCRSKLFERNGLTTIYLVNFMRMSCRLYHVSACHCRC